MVSVQADTVVVLTEYDGCGKCFVIVRRLSRKSDATSSPEAQLETDLFVVRDMGGHVIGIADDWEVSGATDPLTRPGLGPWLKNEKGPYSGIVGSAVDRIGRNLRDILNTTHMIHKAGKLLLTYGHTGPWNLDDEIDEARLSYEALGAQSEHRAVRKRNRNDTVRARAAGEPKQMNAYGFRYVRLVPTGKVDHVALDSEATETIREVARRILTDETDLITPYTEAARLTRAGVLSPRDHRAVMYGKEPKGTPWTGPSLINILTSEASLGYLMHGGRPVLGKDGHPVRLCEGLWDRSTRDRLVIACQPAKPTKRTEKGKLRAPKGIRMGSGRGICGNCKRPLKVGSRSDGPSYLCNGRVTGAPGSAQCKPAPSISAAVLDKELADWFIAEYGEGLVMRREFDPGTGHAARIAELEADRKRLRDDRSAGLYDEPDDAEWYRTEYLRMGRELREVRALPQRPAGMRLVSTGRTVAQVWESAADDAARRELLAAYDVEVTLLPKSAPVRLEITGRDATAGAYAQAA